MGLYWRRALSLGLAVVGVGALGGCDRLFGLTGQALPIDGAGSDALAIDGPILPCPNGSNHDEDGDHIDDACDHCPGVPAVADGNGDVDADSDGDNIGDECDPLPTEPCTNRVGFYAFTTAPNSLVIPPDWTVDGEDLVSSDETLSFARLEQFAFTNVFVSTSVHLESMAGAVSLGTHLEFEDGIDSPTLGYLCRYDEGANVDDDRVSIVQLPAFTVLSARSETQSRDQLMSFYDADGATLLTCRVGNAKLDGHAPFDDPSMGRIAVGVEGTRARFHWLDVISMSTCDFNPTR